MKIIQKIHRRHSSRDAQRHIRGIYRTIINSRLHHKNAFLMRVGLATRESNKPAKKEYIVRTKPMYTCCLFNVQPPLTSQLGLVMAMCANAIAAITTKTLKAVFENFRRKMVYRILAIYSKKSNQPTLLSGCISSQLLYLKTKELAEQHCN